PRPFRLLLSIALSVGACQPGQWLIHVDTDAPLEGIGPDWSPLFDRLLVQVLPSGASEPCIGCARELAVTQSQLEAGAPSFGTGPEAATSGHRLRLRLFHALPIQRAEP